MRSNQDAAVTLLSRPGQPCVRGAAPQSGTHAHLTNWERAQAAESMHAWPDCPSPVERPQPDMLPMHSPLRGLGCELPGVGLHPRIDVA
jgi:hypothetical protein